MNIMWLHQLQENSDLTMSMILQGVKICYKNCRKYQSIKCIFVVLLDVYSNKVEIKVEM